jgi:REP element-mobilizing transposase RayT
MLAYRNKRENDMTYHITALTNNKARLISNEARISGVKADAARDALVALWTAQGYIVVVREEC